jgi:hypothetical protein
MLLLLLLPGGKFLGMFAVIHPLLQVTPRADMFSSSAGVVSSHVIQSLSLSLSVLSREAQM